jgi:hypothetical protein
MQKISLTIRVDADDLTRWKASAKRLGISTSVWIRGVLNETKSLAIPGSTAHKTAAPAGNKSVARITGGELLSTFSTPTPTLEPEQGVMCSYTEYDPETGETYRCGRQVHGPKVKHTRGEKL